MTDIDLGIFQANTDDILAKVCAHMHDPDRRGGYLCIATSTGKILAVFLVGEVADETKAMMYHGYACEKARRLGNSPNYVSSWEGRNELAGRYGGAIRGEDLIFSFSGFLEYWDEIFVLDLCAALHYEVSPRITDISENPHAAFVRSMSVQK